MKRYLLLEINDDLSVPMTVSSAFDRINGSDGCTWYGQFHGGRVITDDDLGGNSGGDLIKALAVAVHRDAAVAAITGGSNHEPD